MNCTQCGEMLFSALERTRGVCASCFLSYKPARKAEAIGRPSDSPMRAAESEEGDHRMPEMNYSGESGERTR